MSYSHNVIVQVVVPGLFAACFSWAAPTMVGGNWEGWLLQGSGTIGSRQDGFIEISYESPERQRLLLRPALPLELPSDLTRIGLWFAMVRGDADIAFLVTDVSGAEHRVTTYATKLQGPEIRYDPKRRIEWPLWTQAESRILRFPDATEIARRVLPEFQTAVHKAVWASPWRLTGIEIKPATYRDRRWGGGFTRGQYQDMDAGRGTICLTDLGWHTRTSMEADFYSALAERLRWARDESPVLFLDDLTTQSGSLHYALEIRTGYQGPVAWRHEGKGQLDRSDAPGLFASRILLPQLPQGDYWLRTWTWNDEGCLEQERLMRWFVFKGNGELPAAKTRFGWTTDQPANVFASTTKEATLHLRAQPTVFDRIPENTICRIHIMDWRQNVVLQKNVIPTEQQTLTCPVIPGNDYFARAEFCIGDTVYDRACLHFGVANAEAGPVAGTVPVTVPNRNEFLDGHAYLQSEYRHNDIFARDYPWVQNFDPADFELFIRQAKQAGSKTITVGACLGDIAILPGVYRWQHLDEQIAIASRHGLKVVLNYIMGTADGRTCPLSIPRTPFLGQFGNAFPSVPGTSHWNAAWDRERLAYYRKMAQRYLGSSDVIGYQVKNYCLVEQFVGEYRTADYSQPARKAFQDWQRQEGLVPVELPAPFILPMKNPSLPEFGPDLSPEWVRFLDFNAVSGHRITTRLLDTIRDVDPIRQIQLDRKHICYAVENLIPELKNGSAMKNEGSPGFRDIPLRSMCEQAGVPFLEELHRQIPTSRSIADSTYFYNSYLSRSIFWLFRWKPEHLENKKHPMFRTLEDMLGYLERVHPRWEEYIQAREPEPEALVFGSRADQVLGPPHRGEFNSIAGIDVMESLFVSHNFPTHFADEYTDWVEPSRFRLVFARGAVMRKWAIDRILAYAKTGGKLVLIGDAGHYCPELPNERNLLVGPLADLPNVRTLADPVPLVDADGKTWSRVKAFSHQELEEILAWAGIRRRIVTTSASGPGFQCILRESPDRNRMYAAIMRTWNGTFYRGEIEFQEQLEEKYGTCDGTVTVNGLLSGRWHVEKIHREPSDCGTLVPNDGQLTLTLDPAVVGEVQLFRLTRLPE